MKTYLVDVQYESDIEVEADSEEDALIRAEEMYAEMECSFNFYINKEIKKKHKKDK
jgi:hypothetical protein